MPGSGGVQAIKDELIEQIKASEAIIILLPDTYEKNASSVTFHAGRRRGQQQWA